MRVFDEYSQNPPEVLSPNSANFLEHAKPSRESIERPTVREIENGLTQRIVVERKSLFRASAVESAPPRGGDLFGY